MMYTYMKKKKKKKKEEKYSTQKTVPFRAPYDTSRATEIVSFRPKFCSKRDHRSSRPLDSIVNLEPRERNESR